MKKLKFAMRKGRHEAPVHCGRARPRVRLRGGLTFEMGGKRILAVAQQGFAGNVIADLQNHELGAALFRDSCQGSGSLPHMCGRTSTAPKGDARHNRYSSTISDHRILSERAVLHGPTALGLLLFQDSNYRCLNRPPSMLSQHDFFNDPPIWAICAKDRLVLFSTTGFTAIQFA
ncbi:hypothetical protein [Thioclava sp. ES.031]|uniref:hypothetical protein n=1 Tax=Thioclava sp. ES.031 TaxID=1798203 RepID=UPI0011453E73|nr:hypothetical protein [Thioclava sp. ES.031]